MSELTLSLILNFESDNQQDRITFCDISTFCKLFPFSKIKNKDSENLSLADVLNVSINFKSAHSFLQSVKNSFKRKGKVIHSKNLVYDSAGRSDCKDLS